jgi:hypothetical protein
MNPGLQPLAALFDDEIHLGAVLRSLVIKQALVMHLQNIAYI